MPLAVLRACVFGGLRLPPLPRRDRGPVLPEPTLRCARLLPGLPTPGLPGLRAVDAFQPHPQRGPIGLHRNRNRIAVVDRDDEHRRGAGRLSAAIRARVQGGRESQERGAAVQP